MVIGGFVIAVGVCIVILLFPVLVARRTAITQSREIDRFSPRMRLLEGSSAGQEKVKQELVSGPALLHEGRHLANEGGMMTEREGVEVSGQVTSALGAGGVTGISSAAGEQNHAYLVRQHAVLRSRRAARLSREMAAGRRRMFVSACCAVLSGVVLFAVLAGSLSWVWLLASLCPLGLVLIYSRFATLRADAANRAETEEMRRLRDAMARSSHHRREKARGRGGSLGGDIDAHSGGGVGASCDSDASSDLGISRIPDGHGAAAPSGAVSKETPADSSLSPVSLNSRDVSESREGELIEPHEEDVAGPRGETSSAPREKGDAKVTLATGLTWSLTPVPAPTYARRGRVTGRQIHADTDIRGIPRVQANIPARPFRAQEVPDNAVDTVDVVASQMVALDLDAVLEARRAQ